MKVKYFLIWFVKHLPRIVHVVNLSFMALLMWEERQISLIPLKRVYVIRRLSITYKMHNPEAPGDVNSTTMFVNLICSKYGQLRGNIMRYWDQWISFQQNRVRGLQLFIKLQGIQLLDERINIGYFDLIMNPWWVLFITPYPQQIKRWPGYDTVRKPHPYSMAILFVLKLIWHMSGRNFNQY